MKQTYVYITLIITLVLSGELLSQNAIIRGTVYEKESGEPVIFTNVLLEGTTLGAATDVDGFYTISKVPPGTYTLSVTNLGYDTLREEITVKADQILTKNLYLQKSSIKLKEVNISAEREEKKTEVQVSLQKITPREIEKVPTIGGEADLAQYLQVLPGVIFTGDQGGQLYIRGGSPVQNKVLLDGMIVYNPFHSIGLFSVFDTDIMRNVDVYSGGFGAEYGGRISSIMDITTRDGSKKRLSGKASTTTFGSKLLLEGPMKKKEIGQGSSSFILSGKTSYLDRSSKILYKYIDEEGLPYRFNDLYGKVSFNGVNGSKLNLFGFNFTDHVDYQNISDLDWNSYGFGSNFRLVPAASKTIINGAFAYSNYKISLLEADGNPRTSIINGFNMGLDFTYFEGKNEWKYGLEVLGFSTDFTFFNSVNREIKQKENTTELGGFVTYKIVTDKLLIEPGFRAHYYASLANFSPEPRLGAKFIATDRMRLKFAGGYYAQNLISANSDRDVVNLFYGFLSGPEELPDEFDGNPVKHRLQKARHAVFGVEYDITSNLEINVEAYHKRFSQLTNVNRNKLYEDNGANFNKPDHLKKDFIIERGNAYGADLVLKYDNRQLYIWAVYSLGKVDRFDGLMEYNPHFDRRHNVNLVAAYEFGKERNWEFSARWNLGSGFPFTQTQGFYEKLVFTDGVNTDYTTANGELGIQYAELNGGRLPYYHRLDATLKRKFELKKNSKLDITASLTNVYDRQNIFYFDRVRYTRVDQLPILPSLGMSLTF